jgi:hypothetical protein
MPEDETDGTTLRIVFPPYEETVPVYSNQATVHFTGDEFVIGFYIALPPILPGTREERRKQIIAVGEIPAKCVARVVVPKSRMPALLNALNNNAARAFGMSRDDLKGLEEDQGDG